MPDNLTVAIKADAGQLLGQIKLVGSELKNLGRQIDAAVKSGDTARAAELSKQFGKMQAGLAGLNKTAVETGAIVPRALNNITAASQKAGRGLQDLARSGMGFRRIVSQFSSLGRGLESIGSIVGGLAGGFAGAFAGVAVVQAIGALIGQLAEIEKKLLNIQKLAREANVRPNTIQAAQELAKGLGEAADAGEKMVTGPAALFAKERTTDTFGPGGGAAVRVMRGSDATGPGVAGIKVYRGAGAAAEEAGSQIRQFGSEVKNGVQVLRGAAPIALDFGNALKLVGVDAKNYAGDAEGLAKFTRDLYIGFQKLAGQKIIDTTQLNEVSKKLFEGLPADAALRLAPVLIAQQTAKIAELETAARNAEAQLKLMQDRAAAKERLGLTTAVEEFFSAIRKGWIEADTATMNYTATFIQTTLPQWKSEMVKTFTDAWAETSKLFSDGWASVVADSEQAWDGFWSWLKSSAQATADAMTAAFKAVTTGISQVTGGNPFGDPSIPAMPGNAEGGLIRGPGTGTSDSIMARLSNGEYVMRAAAVNRWGPRFMASLNALRSPFGFAAGGPVTMPSRGIPSFAGGGLVTAGMGGATVNLVFPGGSFSLRGDNETVGALTREARRAGMLAAGRGVGVFQ